MDDPRPDSDTAGTPLWVKVFAIISLVVVLLFFTMLFTRSPHHGPGEHGLPWSRSGHTPENRHS